MIDPDRDLDHRTIVHRVGKLAIVQSGQQTAHAFLCIGEHVIHIGGDDFCALVARRRLEQFHPPGARCQLSAQIGNVAIGVARRIAG